MKLQSKALRDSAKGQDCTLNIPGACNYDPETVVLAHFPDESGGMGLKSNDFCAGFACSKCHDVIDRRTFTGWNADEFEYFMRRSQNRTMRRWLAMGLVSMRGARA